MLSTKIIEAEVGAMLLPHLRVSAAFEQDQRPSEYMEVSISRPDGFGHVFRLTPKQLQLSLDSLQPFLHEMVIEIVPKLLSL